MKSIVGLSYFIWPSIGKNALNSTLRPYLYPQRTLNSRKLHTRKSLSKDIFCVDKAYIGIVHVLSN